MNSTSLPALKMMKRGLLYTASRLGVLRIVADSRWRRHRLLIIAFHSVALDQEEAWRRYLYFTPDEFERRLQLLRRWRLNVLPLDEAIERLQRGTLPPRSAVLTFDDGHVDFCQISWPALQRADYPATVYATTYYSGKRLPVFPLMCSYVLWKARHQNVVRCHSALGLPAVDLRDDTAREAAAVAIVTQAHREGLDAGEKNARTALLAAHLGIDYDALMRRRVLQIMTPEEMGQVAASGADVQLHSHRHQTPSSQSEFEREILANRAHIEAATGRPAQHFCYPSGVHHAACLPWLEALGVRTATTCTPGLARRTDSQLLLPRLVDTAALNEVEIEGWLSGFSQCLPQRRTPDEPQPRRAGHVAAR